MVLENKIENLILMIRGHKVILDADLSFLYEVSTKRLNEQVKRNIGRFPTDFMFQLNEHEKAEVVANCDHLHKLKFSSTLPYAFTEHGAIMAANVLNNPKAIEISVLIVRAFIQLRTTFASHRDLSRKLQEIEKKYDVQFKVVFDAIRELMTPPVLPKKKIGFL